MIFCKICQFYWDYWKYGRHCPRCGTDGISEIKNQEERSEKSKEKNFFMAKLTIVAANDVDFEGKNGRIVGKQYTAFTEGGKAVQFFSREEHEIFEGLIDFDLKHSEEVILLTKVWDGQIKFSERPRT